MTIIELIDKLNEDLEREYSHWAFYLAASTNVVGLHREEIGEFFLKAAESEMAHIVQFRKMIQGLITKRKLHTSIAKTVSSRIAFFRDDLIKPEQLLAVALQMEEEVVKNYAERIEDCCVVQENGSDEDAVDAKYVELFLEDQLTDSRGDADNIREMLR